MILFSQTSIHDYKKLCLGVSEKQDKPDENVYEKLQNQFNLERESSAFTK